MLTERQESHPTHESKGCRMRQFLFAVCLAVSSVNTASAQWFCWPSPPPPQPLTVYWVPTVVLIEPLPSEVWRDTEYCNVQYCLDGEIYIVTQNGWHVRTGETFSEKVEHKFVEPYCSFTGQRVRRQLSEVPLGAKEVGRRGVKSIFEVNGERTFATWVMVGDTIKTVWLTRLSIPAEVAPQPTIAPTPDVHFGPASPSPSDRWEEEHPRNRNGAPVLEYEDSVPGPTLSIPPVPEIELPPAAEPTRIPQRKTSEEPEKIRIKAPVASTRTVRS